MPTPIRIQNFPLQQETDAIIGIGIEIHKTLGFGFLEIVYKDAYEYEFKKRLIHYEREKEYVVPYKDTILQHRFFADFVVFDKIILDLKVKNGIVDEDLRKNDQLSKMFRMQGRSYFKFWKDKTRHQKSCFLT